MSASARSLSRSAARLAAVQALYQQEMEGTPVAPLLHEFHHHRLGATIDGVEYADAEVDFYGGFRGEKGGFALDAGVIFYAYVNEPNFADYNYTEFKLAASRAVGPASIGAAVYYSPDFFGVDETATYYEINGSFAPADKLTISGAVGQQTLDVTDDYVTWNIGATYALLDNVAIDVRYHDTDVDGATAYEDRIVGGLKFLF